MKEPYVSESCEKKMTENIKEMIDMKENLIKTKVIDKPERMHMFGVSLDRLISVTPNLNVPFILSRLCGYIEKYGLQESCLFQMRETDKTVDGLKKQFDEFGDASLESEGNSLAVAKLLKIFLQELPEPLIPTTVYTTSIEDMKDFAISSEEFLQCLRSLVDKLPIHTFRALKYLCHFFMLLTMHADVNGLSCADIGLIFGPLIFRERPDGSDVHGSFARNATCSFISDYYSIFEDKEVQPVKSKRKITPDPSQISPLPSSIAPVMNLKPLNVMIPQTDMNLNDERNSGYQRGVPALLIERPFRVGSHDNSVETLSADHINVKSNSETPPTSRRKRKDNVPAQMFPTILDKETSLSTHEFVESQGVQSCDKRQTSMICSLGGERSPIIEDSTENHELFTLSSRTPDFEGDTSPHPPNPKRRELEILGTENQACKENFPQIDSTEEEWLDENEEDLQYVDCDSPCSDENHSVELMSPFPRSASCPLSISDDAEDTDSFSNSSLSWHKLFDSVEPVRALHRLSWPNLNVAHDDTDGVPTVINQHNSCVAPLSPSAFRPHLSYRSAHLDPSLPPSPPGEQENFDFIPEDNRHDNSSKILLKRIRSLKKKLKRFDKKFEREYGYKPSYYDKTTFPETKKWIDEMHKLKQKLEALEEELQSPTAVSTSVQNWFSTSKVHVLEDTTNCLESKEYKDSNIKSKPTVDSLCDEALKSLEDDRKLLNRPECLEHMTKEQVEDEKLAIQKALLRIESIHGKPTEYADRNKIRPLYDRYRSVKYLVRSSAFSSGVSITASLQPIMEHEAMDFTVSQKNVKQQTELNEAPDSDSYQTEKDANNSSEFHSRVFLHKKYNNSNLHELPVTELVSQHLHARSEKKRLRKVLREFEADFLRSNGRKVQKEDKAPVEEYYMEYKFIKARIKLLEALISKHGLHK